MFKQKVVALSAAVDDPDDEYQCGHSAAITSDGQLFTWGSAVNGRLGHGEEALDDQLTPRLVEALEGKQVVAVAASNTHMVACTGSGELWNWGNLQTTEHTPRLVQGMVGRKVVAVAAGWHYTAVVTDDGELWSFGNNSKGQLGLGHKEDQCVPQRVTALEGKRVVGVCCGECHTMALTATGEVYSWGGGNDGQLGHGSDELYGGQNESAPRRVEALQAVAGISAGSEHSAAWSAEGAMWTWGFGACGRLGHGNENDQFVPCLVEALAGKKVVGVAAGCLHTVAWTDTEQLFTWGSNEYGQLGDGDEEMDENEMDENPCLFLPRMVQALEGQCVVRVAAAHHTLVTTDNDAMFAFGLGASGQLGVSSNLSLSMPTEVAFSFEQ